VTAVATSSNGLRKGGVVAITNQSTTGISDPETDQENDPEILLIQNSIHITLKDVPQWKDARVRILSVDGKEIYNSPLEQGHNQVDINSEPGIFIVVVQSVGELRTRKVFLE
jgi:hypothetical protein